MLWKINDCESLEISQENFYDGISFYKNTNLQCSDCNFAIKRTHQGFFLEYLQKTNCLKRIKREKVFFLRKTVYDGQAS